VASDPTNGPLIVLQVPTASSYAALAKEGSLTAPWDREYSTGVLAVAAASDAVHGPMIGLGRGYSDSLVKEGSLTAAWVKERSQVPAIGVAG
jgi:hypothetical protein